MSEMVPCLSVSSVDSLVAAAGGVVPRRGHGAVHHVAGIVGSALDVRCRVRRWEVDATDYDISQRARVVFGTVKPVGPTILSC